MNERILFVDDEPDALSAYRRQLCRRFSVETATSGSAALAILDAQAPFAVIVSDMRMPEMDGIKLLSLVEQRAPHTVRIMLTGNADRGTAIDAVNEGHIFRFLTKPCQTDSLMKALTAALEQYRLLEAERELLEKTLRASVKVLTDTLSLLNPLAFSRGARIRRCAKDMAQHLGLQAPWQYELAAMLCQIGCVVVPLPVLEKAVAGKPLNKEEQLMYASHPSVGAELLANIPRLERVARMIEGQQRPFNSYSAPLGDKLDEDVEAGAQLLKTCLDFDTLLQQGVAREGAFRILERRQGDHNPRMLAALYVAEGKDPSLQSIREIFVHEATSEMTAAEHIRTKANVLIVPKDQEFSPQVLARLRNFSARVGVQEPFIVYTRAAVGVRPSREDYV